MRTSNPENPVRGFTRRGDMRGRRPKCSEPKRDHWDRIGIRIGIWDWDWGLRDQAWASGWDSRFGPEANCTLQTKRGGFPLSGFTRRGGVRTGNPQNPVSGFTRLGGIHRRKPKCSRPKRDHWHRIGIRIGIGVGIGIETGLGRGIGISDSDRKGTILCRPNEVATP